MSDKKLNPYAVLGLQRGASEAEIRKAHRTLIAACHPDRLMHLAPPARKKAEAKARHINAARDMLLGGQGSACSIGPAATYARNVEHYRWAEMFTRTTRTMETPYQRTPLRALFADVSWPKITAYRDEVADQTRDYLRRVGRVPHVHAFFASVLALASWNELPAGTGWAPGAATVAVSTGFTMAAIYALPYVVPPLATAGTFAANLCARASLPRLFRNAGGVDHTITAGSITRFAGVVTAFGAGVLLLGQVRDGSRAIMLNDVFALHDPQTPLIYDIAAPPLCRAWRNLGHASEGLVSTQRCTAQPAPTAPCF